MPEDTEWLDCEEPRGAAYSIRDRVVRLRLVMLKAVSGPDDDGAPCITLMLTDQD
jgi:hypothetical protein